MSTARTVVIGGGAWGMAAALAACRTGADVTVLEAGSLPAERAASTDVSKAVRASYGTDRFYAEQMRIGFGGWRAWNMQWPRPLFHETGVVFLAGAHDGFETASFRVLRDQGAPVNWLSPDAIATRFPQWAPGRFVGGFVNQEGGWAESGGVVARLAQMVRALGGRIRTRTPVTAIEGHRVRLTNEVLVADRIIVAAGAWTPTLLPELAPCMWPSAHPIFILAPDERQTWQAPNHLTFGADIGRTGWYGFPALPDGRLKIAHHGVGWRRSPDGDRTVPPAASTRLRSFLGQALPALKDAPLVEARACVYCDTFDGHFWIDRHPNRPDLMVVAGGSGHGFKFTPRVVDWVRDLLAGKPAVPRFAWRRRGAVTTEDARAQV